MRGSPRIDLIVGTRRALGTNLQRLNVVKSATAGQPLFIFDFDACVLHGPFAVVAPGNLNLEGGNTRLPAQVKFNSVVRNFLPLPAAAVSDLLNFDVAGLSSFLALQPGLL